jgi:hypothetical protein
MMVYVVVHPDLDPFVFMDRDDAHAFARARWGVEWATYARVESQSLIDHDLALQMTSDELLDDAAEPAR